MEDLLPRALPLSDTPDQIVQKAYQILMGLLSSDAITADLKRYYGRHLKTHVGIYFAEQLTKKNAVEYVMYQSACNKMFNDFDALLQPWPILATKEVFSWKKAFWSLVGGLLVSALSPRFKRAAFIGGSAGIHLTWSGLNTFESVTQEKKVAPCFPPYCPVIFNEPKKEMNR
ncbi:MAG: hypothetical protein Q8P84_06840, partial [Deltaproteobacteria bacterium]|nr:hypothetical protein [Deltaproteobacteria bacterium]